MGIMVTLIIDVVVLIKHENICGFSKINPEF